MDFFDLFDILDWFVDPLRESVYDMGSLLGSILDALAAMPVTFLVMLMGLAPLLFVVLVFVAMYWFSRAFNMLLDSERVQFVLATKRWPRNLASAILVVAAITISAASVGFLETATAPFVVAYSGNPGLWAATAVIVALIGGVIWLIFRVDQTLAFQYFQKPKMFDKR